jgi:hypothetical protein
VTDLQQFHRDIKALERWLGVGALDTKQLTVAQVDTLKGAVARCTTKMIGFRIGLDKIVSRRKKSN